MEHLNDLTSIIALSMGVAWASGINLYAAILTLGLLSISGNMQLPPSLEIVTHPAVMTVAAILFLIEFFVDKTPGADSGWDAIQTFIRIPAGAVLAATAVGDVSAPLAVAAGLVGGGVSAATHATKAGSRLIINTSPEPFSNWTASLLEDFAVITGVWIALHNPVVFLVLLTLFLLSLVWILPKICRGIMLLLSKLRGIFAKTRSSEPSSQQ